MSKNLHFKDMEDYKRFLADRFKPKAEFVSEKPSKFHNVICEADNIKFRSKKERQRYLELKALQASGECWFLRQVPFYLPGNTKYLLDFMVFWTNGNTTFEDTKGKRTPMFIMKKKQVEALYPITIIEN
jgi:hypothetical protein